MAGREQPAGGTGGALVSTLFENGRDMITRVMPAVWVNEAVTLYRRTDDTYGTGDACPHAKRSALTNRDTRVQLGLIPAGTITFLLLDSDLSNEPRQHDKIVDAASVSWLINFVQKIVMDGDFWRCEVTRAN